MKLKLNPVGSNQTEVEWNGTVVLFSYKTPVAALVAGKRMIVTDTHYSRTTSKHINQAAARWGAMERKTVPQADLDRMV